MNVYSPITVLKGVGPKTSKELEKCMIFNIMDLLLYLPREYEFIDHYNNKNSQGKKVMIKVNVDGINKDRKTKTGKVLTTISFNDGERKIIGTWFNQPYMKRMFIIGETYLLQGTLKEYKGVLTLTSGKIVKEETIEDRKSVV